MSNSNLIQYTDYSPNHSGQRTHAIDRITPHCVVGQCTIEALGELFSRPARMASSNYGIDKDGKIGLFVDECNRSWCSSSGANDQRAVTIECASDTTAPYAFKDIVYNKLIVLCTDICKRYNKTKLLWINDKTKALNYNPKNDEMLLTVHRWFASTMCPGEWLMSRMQNLADSVTAKLTEKEVKKEEQKTEEKTKIDKFLTILEGLGQGQYHYYDGKQNGIGCSEYVKMALKKAGIIAETDTFHAGTGNVGILADTTKFTKIAWSPNNLKAGDILWSHGHHVAVWDGKNGVYEASPESTHGICDNKKTGVGHWSNHTYRNCGTGTNTWSCIYRLKGNGKEEKKEDKRCPYLVKIDVSDLRIRKGAGTNTKIIQYIKPGIYTIVAEKDGTGATKWGKLKSGIGWISLDWAKYLKNV